MISIIIPLYNKINRIEYTIKSILCQTIQDFEIVVVNDGSTDQSELVVEKIRDTRIRLINQVNGGPSKARNTGVSEAKGEWILFLDADDELLPNALSVFKSLTLRYPKGKCFACNFYSRRNGKKRLYSYSYSEKIIENPFMAWSFHRLFPRTGASLFHKGVTNDFCFNEKYRRYEDAEWLFRIMRKYWFVRCPIPVMVYNEDSAEASAKRMDIREDYLGNMDILSGTIGEKLAKYQLFKQAERLYPVEIESLYKNRWCFAEVLCLALLYQATKVPSSFGSFAKRIGKHLGLDRV